MVPCGSRRVALTISDGSQHLAWSRNTRSPPSTVIRSASRPGPTVRCGLPRALATRSAASRLPELLQSLLLTTAWRLPIGSQRDRTVHCGLPSCLSPPAGSAASLLPVALLRLSCHRREPLVTSPRDRMERCGSQEVYSTPSGVSPPPVWSPNILCQPPAVSRPGSRLVQTGRCGWLKTTPATSHAQRLWHWAAFKSREQHPHYQL